MVTGPRNSTPRLAKLETARNCSIYLRREVVVTILLVVGLAFLVGCQGVSTSTSSGALASGLASLSFGNVQVGNKQTLSVRTHLIRRLLSRCQEQVRPQRGSLTSLQLP